MGDKPRSSIASSVGGKGAVTIAAQFKRLFYQNSSSLSNVDDGKDDKIELENLLRIEDLEKLRTQGFARDRILNKEEFIEFLRNSLHRGNEKDYEELFECVDVTKEGFVSWEKLSTYVMLKLYDNDDREKASSVPNWKNGKSILNAHRDSVKSIRYMNLFSRYISISKEGTVCIYNDELQLYKTFKAPTESCKIRDLWITDFVLMTNINKIAVAYTSKELLIYEMSSKLELNLVYKITDIDSAPYCLDYWFDQENQNDAILSWGDVKGNVHAILFNSALIALFERPPQQTNDKVYTRVKIDDIAKENYKNASYITYKAHTEWTRKVKYADHLDCFISCSTNSKTALVFGWMDKSGLTVRVNYSVRARQLRETRSVVEINQGLNSFDYSRNFNLIATAGVNYQVCLWNPYVLSKPNGILRGHMRSVIYVQFIPNRGQLLSFSKDRILRIWDVQLQIVLQRLSNIFPRGPDVDIFCWFDDEHSRLFAAFRTSISMMEIKPEIKDRIMTHERAIVAARFVVKQKQVMIVCQAGDVSFWSLEGQKTKRFSEQGISEAFDTTCLGFDEFGEKFYTGGSDGKIRIWNYNGRVIQTLDAGRGTAAEITQIEALKRRIVAVGWSKYLTVFRDLQQGEGRPSLPTDWNGEKDKNRSEGHEDDIICMAVTSYTPQLLASGSADGDICIWNTSSELFVRRLDQRKRNPNNTQAKLQDNAADFAITTLRFLDKRMASNASSMSSCANLISCGGIGFARFWNVHAGKLVGEFQAHADVSSIIMEIDTRNKYLATGDVNGTIKLWDIEQYCLQSNFSDIEKNSPPFLSQFTPHSDSITCIDFVDKDERIFLLTSSSDCSVVLSDMNGNPYGTFGQPNQWRLDVDLSKLNEENSQISQSKEIEESHDESSNRFNEESRITLSQNVDDLSSVTDEEMLTRRSNVWESTSIGVSFQEKRTNRRQRNQPTLITKKDFLLWEKTGLAPGGAYGALDTFDPPAIPDQKKSAYLDSTYLWHAQNFSDGARRRVPPTMIGENLKSAFDERSIFPKYILDYETKQRQLFESTYPQQTTSNASQGNLTQTLRQTEGMTKSKRLGSSSTLLSDSKAQ